MPQQQKTTIFYFKQYYLNTCLIKQYFLLMKELLQALPNNTKNDDCLPKEERFNIILSQLQERNTINQQFIRKFIAKINKKYNQREIPFPHHLDTCPEIIEQQQRIESALPTSSLQRFHTEEQESQPPLKHSITDGQVLKNHIRTLNELGDLEDKDKKGKERASFERTYKNIRSTYGEDEGFKNYLKKVYFKQISDRKPKPIKLQKGVFERKSIQGPSSTKTKCLNIKSMVFGSQDLNILSQEQQSDVIPSEMQIEISNFPTSQGAINPKLSNIFLPTITRQNGGKKDKMRFDKMMKIPNGQQDRPDSKCRALWLSESLNRIGLSFRINTIHIKKHS